LEKEIAGNVFVIHSISFFFVVIIGSLLHFCHEWSGYNPIAALFCAVNESVWEHLKLGFWSFILFSIIDFWFLKDTVQNYFFAKAVSILSMQVFIVLFFYTYTFFLKHHNLFFDITLFITGALLCHIISYLLMSRKSLDPVFRYTGIGLLLLQAFCLILFTYFPPHLPIFKDGITGKYGVEWGDRDHNHNH
jgi:hypothetical protein